MAWVALGVAAIGAYGKTQEAKSKSSGGGMMPGIGMETESRSVNEIFDNSGWNVSFGNSKIDSTAEKSQNASGPNLPQSPSLGATNIGQPAASAAPFAGLDNQTLIYGAVGIALLAAWKNKKS